MVQTVKKHSLEITFDTREEMDDFHCILDAARMQYVEWLKTVQSDLVAANFGRRIEVARKILCEV